MSDVRVPFSAAVEEGTRMRDRFRSPVVLLNLAGIVLVGAALLPGHIGTADVPRISLGTAALVAWAVWTLSPTGRVRDVAIAVGGLVAAVGTGLGATALLAPAIAALIMAISDTTRTTRALVALVVAIAAALAVGAVAHGQSLDDLVSELAGLAIGALGGTTRRQRKVAGAQERELLQQSLSAEREAERAQLLESRSTAARDVHDVLAHSLGGLVLQLDAIEALLEHGRVEEASVRATAARRLAGEGLSEARRAVAALRDPDSAMPAPLPDDALELVVAAHRELGGRAEIAGDPSLRGVDAAHREALTATLREALVNARRHAPGATTRIRFAREPHAMVLHVENPMPAPGTAASTVGGGHGLVGLQERFAALGDGSTATVGPRAGVFVVDATAVLP